MWDCLEQRVDISVLQASMGTYIKQISTFFSIDKIQNTVVFKYNLFVIQVYEWEWNSLLKINILLWLGLQITVP